MCKIAAVVNAYFNDLTKTGRCAQNCDFATMAILQVQSSPKKARARLTGATAKTRVQELLASGCRARANKV